MSATKTPKTTAKKAYTLTGTLLTLAKNARKGAKAELSGLALLAQSVVRFDAKVKGIAKKDRKAATDAFNAHVRSGFAPEQARSVSSTMSQIRRAAKASAKARTAWFAGKYGIAFAGAPKGLTIKSVLKAIKRPAVRFSAKREAKRFTVGQLRAMLRAKGVTA